MTKASGRLVAVATASAVACATVAQAAPARELGGATPQAVVERMTRATEKKDFADLVASLEPESRKEMTLALLMGTTMMVAFMGMGSEMAAGMAEGMSEAISGEGMKAEDKAKMAKQKAEAAARTKAAQSKLSAIFKKHGLPDLTDDSTQLPEEEGAAEKMLAQVDQPGLAADLIGFMDTFGDKKEGARDPMAAGGPLGVPGTVTDYKITGDTATAKSGKETLEFVRIDGRWFFKPPQEKGKGAGKPK